MDEGKHFLVLKFSRNDHNAFVQDDVRICRVDPRDGGVPGRRVHFGPFRFVYYQ